VTFLLLYLWPFMEARLTGDREAHHLLDRPSDHPVRTAIGAVAFTFYAVLFFAASNDVVALLLRAPVGAITWAFRILLLVLPPLVGVIVWRLMAGIRASAPARFLQTPLRAVLVGEGSRWWPKEAERIRPETHEEAVRLEKAREEGQPEAPVTEELRPEREAGG
jgi:hypothetical protein